jgi:hypothetical protein
MHSTAAGESQERHLKDTRDARMAYGQSTSSGVALQFLRLYGVHSPSQVVRHIYLAFVSRTKATNRTRSRRLLFVATGDTGMKHIL